MLIPFWSHKTVEAKVFLHFFCLLMEGSGSVRINYGSGSRRPKKHMLRILNTAGNLCQRGFIEQRFRSFILKSWPIVCRVTPTTSTAWPWRSTSCWAASSPSAVMTTLRTVLRWGPPVLSYLKTSHENSDSHPLVDLSDSVRGRVCLESFNWS